jgi:predicted acyl esterase
VKMKKRLHRLVASLLFLKAAVGTLKALRSGRKMLPAAEGEQAPYRREKRVVHVSAGIPIKASVFVPPGEGPFPAVIMVHSWGIWRLQCDLLYAPAFARAGYVVLTYDCRGWGGSGGEVSCAAPDKELVDLQDMITWLTAPDSGIPVDPERIGITGVSYGGGHSFLIAARDERIKAAAPMNGWTDLDFSLMPNGCWKWNWSLNLLLEGLWAIKMNPKNDLIRWFKNAALGTDLERTRGELAERSAIYSVGEVKCPMLIVHSWNDDLFEPNQILKYYERLKAPKRLIMTNGIHGFDGGRGEFLLRNRIWEETRRFFDYWLKDEKDNGIGDEPPVKYYQPWDMNMATAETWPPDGIEERVFYLKGDNPSAASSGTLESDAPEGSEPVELLVNNTVTNFQTSGLPMLRLNVFGNLPIPGMPFSLPGDSAAFTTAPLEKDTTMVGTAKVEFFISSSTSECQVNALLYDVSPRGFCRFVTHCGAMKSDIEPGEVSQFAFELIACAHRFPAGHRIRLVLCASDPLYVRPSRVPSLYRLFHTAEHPARLTLPLEKEASAKLGFLKG